jgi:hypothetical protein
MAFWTASASITSYDHEDGSARRVQMSFHKNMDKELRVQTLDYYNAIAETKHLRWYVCDMCNYRHERKHVLRGNYMNDHFKPPMIHRLFLFGTEIVIVQFQFKYM